MDTMCLLHWRAPAGRPCYPHYTLRVTNKFGVPVATLPGQSTAISRFRRSQPAKTDEDAAAIEQALPRRTIRRRSSRYLRDRMADDGLRPAAMAGRRKLPRRTAETSPALGIETLTLAIDRRYRHGGQEAKFGAHDSPRRTGTDLPAAAALRRDRAAAATADHLGTPAASLRGPRARRNDAADRCPRLRPRRRRLRRPAGRRGISPRLAEHHPLQHAAARGSTAPASARHTDGLRIDCYDNPGDYLGSGMDGLEIYVHGNAQDQLCQIAKRGKLVVYGDVGQTFLYGAKGGEIITSWATRPAAR